MCHTKEGRRCSYLLKLLFLLQSLYRVQKTFLPPHLDTLQPNKKYWGKKPTTFPAVFHHVVWFALHCSGAFSILLQTKLQGGTPLEKM